MLHRDPLPALLERLSEALEEGYVLEETVGVISDGSVMGMSTGIKLWTCVEATAALRDLGQPEVADRLASPAPKGSFFLVRVIDQELTLAVHALDLKTNTSA